MQFGILKTDHGKHSDEKLAVATAAQIIQIAEDAAGPNAPAGRKLELAIIDVLEGHHKKVSEHEVGKLMESTAHLSTPLDPEPHLSDTFDDIMKLAAESPFKEWFARPEVQQHVRDTLACWTATNMMMHRDWHAHGKTGHHLDLRPVPGWTENDKHVQGWFERKHNGVGGVLGSGLPPAIPKAAIGP